MADKKKKKKAAKGPKEIAGIKLPKPLREPAAQLLKAVQSPAFADVAAAALLSAAAALQEGKKAPSASRNPAGPKAAKPKGASTAAGTIGAMLATKAIEGVTRLAAEKAQSGNGSTPARGGKSRKKG